MHIIIANINVLLKCLSENSGKLTKAGKNIHLLGVFQVLKGGIDPTVLQIYLSLGQFQQEASLPLISNYYSVILD